MRIALLDIGGTDIKYALGDTDISPGDFAIQKTASRAGEGAEVLKEQLLELLEGMKPFARIGISTSGQVDPRSGVILFATEAIPHYAGVNLRAFLGEQLEVPVFILNDVNCAAIAEMQLGVGKQYEDFLFLTFGTGIGGAFVHKDEVLLGSSCSAGEYGHIITHAGGKACLCGGRGCYEAYASTKALMDRLEKETGEAVLGSGLPEAMAASPKVGLIVEEWMGEVVAGLASLVHCYNPGAVILGGGIMENKWLVFEISRRLKKAVIASFAHFEVFASSFGNASGLLGAFQMAKNELY